MRRLSRFKNKSCVSPIIAEVLLVTISVLLAAIIYVMVSGMITSTPRPKNIAVVCAKVPSSPNYRCVIASADSSVEFLLTGILVLTSDGTVVAHLPAGFGYSNGSANLQNITSPLAIGTKVVDNGDGKFGLNDEIYLIPAPGQPILGLTVKVSGGGGNGSDVVE